MKICYLLTTRCCTTSHVFSAALTKFPWGPDKTEVRLCSQEQLTQKFPWWICGYQVQQKSSVLRCEECVFVPRPGHGSGAESSSGTPGPVALKLDTPYGRTQLPSAYAPMKCSVGQLSSKLPRTAERNPPKPPGHHFIPKTCR